VSGADFSQDQLRRATREIAAEHTRSLRLFRHALTRIFEDDRVPAEVRSDVALGGLARRRFLRIGATTVAAGAVLAACGNDDKGGSGGGTAAETTTTTAKKASAADITVLRTASSLELVAANVYDGATKSGLLTTPAVADAAKAFMSQHKDHAAVFDSLTKKLGGEPYTEPNPAVAAQVAPKLTALHSENDVVALALELERSAAATYLASVGTFSDPSLNEAIMSVGGVESRHAAVLATVLGQPAVPAAFAVTTGAVPPGTGI
jgi:rubrerythrin